MNPKVFRFTKRPCALIVVYLSHVNDIEEYTALRAEASRPLEGSPRKNYSFEYTWNLV